jgi:hypothetical protein
MTFFYLSITLKNFNIMKIAITIPTGRINVKNTLKSFIDNYVKFGHDLNNLNVYLSIDTQFMNTKREDFLVPEIEKLVKVSYIFEEDRFLLAKELEVFGKINSKVCETILFGRGYAKQRNAALIKALIDGNDVAICVDDDEFAILPYKNITNDLVWIETDFFKAHLDAIKDGADITRGPYLGYTSPIPSDFEKNIPEVIRKKLGSALEIGSEIISSESFMNLMNKIKYFKESDFTKKAFEVPFSKTGKPILTGNAAINLNSVRSGKLPVFYTPPEARGEDAIFALQLKTSKVVEVPAFIFHDPFLIYDKLIEGDKPSSLRNIPVDDESVKRFSSALIGWLKYAPFLLKLTSEDQELKSRLEKMLMQIKEPTIDLAKILEDQEIAKSYDVLKKYSESVEEDYKLFVFVQSEWKNKILPYVNKISNASRDEYKQIEL